MRAVGSEAVGLGQRRLQRLALLQQPIAGEAVGGEVENSHDVGLVSQVWQQITQHCAPYWTGLASA